MLNKGQKEFLKNNWNNYTKRELADKLDMCVTSLYNEADKMGLKRNKVFSSNAKSRKWNENEVLFLEKNYGVLSNSNIAEKLNRSFSSVVQKAKDLRVNNANFWTKSEIDILLSEFSECKSISYLSDKLDRGVSSIKAKAKELGLKRNNYFWSNNEIEKLEELYKNGHTDREISQKINKSVMATKAKRVKLFGKKIVDWTNEDINKLKELYASTNIHDLLRLFPKKTSRQVCRKAREIGLKKNPSLLWTDEEVKLLKNNYSNKTIEELEELFKNKSRSQIKNKSKCLKLKKNYETFLRCFNIKDKVPTSLDKLGVWRVRILNRDNFCCALCGFKDITGIELNAHHIKPVRDCSRAEKYNTNNGICLCISCHKNVNSKEYEFMDLLKNILEA